MKALKIIVVSANENTNKVPITDIQNSIESLLQITYSQITPST